MNEKLILDAAEIRKIIDGISEQIFSDIPDIDNFAIVGVQTRGVEIGNRVRRNIERLSGKSIKSGILDITFHRDDLATRGVLPIIKETRIEFDIDKLTILLVDDVIFTGRTTKAALESLTTFGRPSSIKFMVLIDRGNRELPIQPDYCGHSVKTKIRDKVKVKLAEIDNMEDSVYIYSE
ncbi:MAG: bifunctional pyr operon transcriptional regulator/uracil phosphoribosyltransferase PyrR [Spirochaetes bacterium]|jgi:pyrimidine operon attenuation protein/uracil phosphoribosyltransferase|nr:bifunctional pyr operon transcriptional regulator/uracil phosphoribosyltransferase PyrR [Spirochaetota bacterium]